MINIRKLAAVDMALHGRWLITGEFAFGVLLGLGLAIYFLPYVWLWWAAALAVWLLGIAVNYVPLLIYAILIGRAGTMEQEARPEMARIGRYNVQQILLFVPFLIGAAALVQEWRKR